MIHAYSCNSLLHSAATRQPVHIDMIYDSGLWEVPLKCPTQQEHVPPRVRDPRQPFADDHNASRYIAACDRSRAQAHCKAAQVHWPLRLFTCTGPNDLFRCNLQAVDGDLCQWRFAGWPEVGDAGGGATSPVDRSLDGTACDGRAFQFQVCKACGILLTSSCHAGPTCCNFHGRHGDGNTESSLQASPVSRHAGGIGKVSHSLRAAP